MDISDKLKDPIVISIITGVVVFLYLWYSLSDDIDDKKKKKKAGCVMSKIKRVNLLIPLISAIIVWFVTSCYFNEDVAINPNNKNNNIHMQYKTSQSSNNIKNPFFETFGNTNSTKTKYMSPNKNIGYNLINKKNMKLNKIELPDLFLEVDEN